MNFFGDITCLPECLKLYEIASIIAFIVVISITLLAVSLMIKNPDKRIKTFVYAQAGVFTSILITFHLMKCTEALTVYLYLGYSGIATLLIFGILKFYDRIIIRKLGAKPITSVMDWAQEYVNTLTSATVYYYDSAIPRAFATGKSIFLSIGLIEVLSDDELKAVLAHEAWHIQSNICIPFIKRVSLMKFSFHSESELEYMADNFAEKIAGKEALISARNKIDKVFIE